MPPHDPSWLLAPGLTLAAADYLGVPLAFKARHRLPARPIFRPLDLDRIDPATADFLDDQCDALVALGFGEPEYYKTSDAAPNMTAYLVLLVNRRTGDKANIVVTTHDRPLLLRMSFVAIGTRFDTGVVVATVNLPTIDPFPQAETTVFTQTPSVRDPVDLYALHAYVRGRHVPDGRPVVYAPGDGAETLIRFGFTDKYADLAARGWLEFDEFDDAYALTFRGAYLGAWRMMQPCKAIRTAWMRRRERQILAEFDAARSALGG